MSDNKCSFCGAKRYHNLVRTGETNLLISLPSQDDTTFQISVGVKTYICVDCINQYGAEFKKIADVDGVLLKDNISRLYFDKEKVRWYVTKDENYSPKDELTRSEAEIIIRENGLTNLISQEIWQDAIKSNQPLEC